MSLTPSHRTTPRPVRRCLAFLLCLCALTLASCRTASFIEDTGAGPPSSETGEASEAAREFFLHLIEVSRGEAGEYAVDPHPVDLSRIMTPPKRSDYLVADSILDLRTAVLEATGVERGDVFAIPDGCPPYEPGGRPPISGCPRIWKRTVAFDLPQQIGPGRWRTRKIQRLLTSQGHSATVDELYSVLSSGRWRLEKKVNLVTWN